MFVAYDHQWAFWRDGKRGIGPAIVGKLSDRHGRKKLFVTENSPVRYRFIVCGAQPDIRNVSGRKIHAGVDGDGIFIIGNSHILSMMEPGEAGEIFGPSWHDERVRGRTGS